MTSEYSLIRQQFWRHGAALFFHAAKGRGSIRQKISECAFRSRPFAVVRAADPPAPLLPFSVVENRNSVAKSVAKGRFPSLVRPKQVTSRH